MHVAPFGDAYEKIGEVCTWSYCPDSRSRGTQENFTRSFVCGWNDAFAIFEGLCSLGNGVRPQFLQLEYLHKFTQGLIESALMNHHDLFRKVRVSSSFHTTVAALTSLSYSQHPELLLLL